MGAMLFVPSGKSIAPVGRSYMRKRIRTGSSP